MLHKHKKKTKVQRRQLRNAAAPRSATMRAPRSNAAAPLPTATVVSLPKKTSVPETLQTAGGAAGAALACAFIARENWVPPKFVAGLVTAVGGWRRGTAGDADNRRERSDRDRDQSNAVRDAIGDRATRIACSRCESVRELGADQGERETCMKQHEWLLG